jgi:hypothetical protein
MDEEAEAPEGMMVLHDRNKGKRKKEAENRWFI